MAPTNHCLHIVPGLPPQIGDVGEYALNLAVHLRESHGIQSRFIVCDPDWDGPSRIDGFIVKCLRLRNEAGIWAMLASPKEKSAAVLLHYAGYGYHKLGIPIWLYRGIKSWLNDENGRSAASHKQLSTVFHDLWAAPAKPWNATFYLRKLQQAVVKGLHLRSKVSVTSTRSMQALLENIQPHKTLWLPVPSNVPIIGRSKSDNQRNASLRVAIFGDQEHRSATVRAHTNLLQTLDKKNLLGSAMLLGKGIVAGRSQGCDVDVLQKCISRERIEVLGDLGSSKVSDVLGRADVCLSHLNGEFACNSSTFMTALAARCPVVLRDGKNAAPLNESEHFIASDDSHPSVKRFEQITADGNLDRIAMAGRLWYERYADWNVIARKYEEIICRKTSV